MIRVAAAAITLTVVISSFASAQDATPKFQVFGGYSLLHADTARLPVTNMEFVLGLPANTLALKTNFNGWSAEAQYNADSWVGIVADFGGHTGGPVTAIGGNKISGLPSGSSYSFLAGPVISYRTTSRMTPFVHALFGLDRASLKAGTVSGASSAVSYNAETYNDLTVALGAGLDYRLAQHFALRLAQLDWFHTSVNFNKFYGTAFSSDQFQGLKTNQRNLRFSAGVVVQF
jgi:opacity protein-like surface antigen